MARSIFLERILRSFVGSINDILDDLKISVEGIVEDISTIDGQLDSVKDKMDEVIVAFGQGTQRVNFSAQDTDNHAKVNAADIICNVNSAVISAGTMLSMGGGYVQLRAVYDESVNAANEDPPAIKKSTITYVITHDDGTTESGTLGTTTGVRSSGTPQQGKEITKNIAIDYKDSIAFTVTNGSAVSGNTTPATITGIYIDYSLVSVTEPDGAFIRS